MWFTGRSVRDTAIHECHVDSFFLEGGTTRTIVCGNDGHWSAMVTGCKLGKTGKTQEDRHCVSRDGVWHPDPGPCAMRCPPLPYHPSFIPGGYTSLLGSHVTLTCVEGHRLANGESAQVITCDEETREWTDIQPCLDVKCPEPPDIANATHTRTGVSAFHGETVEYTCVGQTRFTDGQTKKVLRCDHQGKWNLTSDSCQESRCPPVPALQHATPSTTSKATDGTVVEYTCIYGYQFSTDVQVASRRCNGRKWIPVGASCQGVECDELPFLPHASVVNVNGSRRHYPAQVEIQCDTGYTIAQEHSSLKCQGDGTWFNASRGCTKIDCGHPELVKNAIKEPAQHETLYGSQINYTCVDGFWFSGGVYNMMVTCSDGGYWLPLVSLCSNVQCLPLPTWKSILVSSKERFAGARVNVTCQEGNVMEHGSSSVMVSCTNHGEWVPAFKCLENETLVDEPPVEAPLSSIIGPAAIGILLSGFVIIVISDIPTIVRSLWFIKRNIMSAIRNR